MITETKLGPWRVHKGNLNTAQEGAFCDIEQTTAPWLSVATVWADVDELKPEAEANARLMAAAPDLLAACKTLIRFATKRDGTPADVGDVIMTFVEDGSTLNECLDNAAAAIQKAEGM